MARGAKAGVSRRTLLATFGISFSGRFPFGNRLSSDRWTHRPLSRVPYCSFHRWSGLLDFCPPGIQRVGGRFKHDIRGSLRRRPECVPGDRLDAFNATSRGICNRIPRLRCYAPDHQNLAPWETLG